MLDIHWRYPDSLYWPNLWAIVCRAPFLSVTMPDPVYMQFCFYSHIYLPTWIGHGGGAELQLAFQLIKSNPLHVGFVSPFQQRLTGREQSWRKNSCCHEISNKSLLVQFIQLVKFQKVPADKGKESCGFVQKGSEIPNIPHTVCIWSATKKAQRAFSALWNFSASPYDH